jgi:hypothetical protein
MQCRVKRDSFIQLVMQFDMGVNVAMVLLSELTDLQSESTRLCLSVLVVVPLLWKVRLVVLALSLCACVCVCVCVSARVL